MAIVSGTMETYDQVGIREDLSDVIFNIAPTETPFVSGAGRGPRAENTTFEWQTDDLAAADTGNAHTEGDEASFSTPSATTRVSNITQISKKTVIISGTAETVNKAGRQSELAYQLAKRGKELKRDLEAISLENLAGNAASSNNARQTATLNAWLQSNTDRGAGSMTAGADSGHTSGTPTAAATDADTLRAFTETILKDVIESAWTNGGEPDILLVGPFNKRVVSENFSGVFAQRLVREDASPGAAVASIDVYVSDFGNIEIMPNRFQRERDAWLVDFEFVSLSELRPLFQEELAKTGDAEKRQMIIEWGLRVENEAAHGGAFDLTTS